MSKVISKKSKKKVSAVGVITYLILVVLIIGAIGFVFTYTNGFTGDFKTFYVKANDKMFETNTNEFGIKENTEQRFDVVYTFGKLNKKQNYDYKVSIIPNVEIEDFDFTVDTDTFSFVSEPDYSQCFEIVKYDKYFTVNAKEFDMDKLLELKFGQDKVILPDMEFIGSYFAIKVTSSDGKTDVLINIGGAVSSIELDKETILYE